MLINSSPDVYEKLIRLGGMAPDDILSKPTTGPRESRLAYSASEKSPIPGVYKAQMPNGKTISLLRVMFTDFCKMDCFYCPNSHWVPRKRYAFKVEELANLFMELQKRETVAGLFLSSGIAGSGSKTTEKLLKVVDMVRNKHGFKGYIHMKVMPGTEYPLVEEAYRLGTRLSVNIETPSVDHMKKLSTMKDMKKDILDPMEWVNKLTRTHGNGAVGQATQMVVGAADESDRDIFKRIDQLYGEWDLKRVYYAPFFPVRHTPLEEHPWTPMERTNRLYQVDWLKRIYKFTNDEIGRAFNSSGFLSLDDDPKMAIAMENLDAFPVDINAATREQLLRVPGVGPTSVDRIIQNRARNKIDTWRDLEAMGVVRKRAWPFLALPGKRPTTAKQLKLDLFGERVRHEARDEVAAPKVSAIPLAAATKAPGSCGVAGSCVGCSMYGAPGHPGAAGTTATRPPA